jgi:hypothetical protein
VPAPRSGPATRGLPAGPRAASALPHAAAAPRASAPVRGGLDMGWLAACAGLVAAAALLAKPRGPAGSYRRGRRAATAAAATRPADSIAAWPTTSPRRSTT